MDLAVVRVAGAGLVGMMLGSFAGCQVHRSVVGQTVVSPARSFCPQCHHQLQWYDNIPLVSYAVLRGCCRYCKSDIGVRYVLFELCMMGAAVGLALRLPDMLHWACATALAFFFVVSGGIEATTGRIPRFVSIGVALLVAVWLVCFSPGSPGEVWSGLIAGSLLSAGWLWGVRRRWDDPGHVAVLVAVVAGAVWAECPPVVNWLLFATVFAGGIGLSVLVRRFHVNAPAISSFLGVMWFGSVVL